jgi:ABC-type lipoprotein release transport system permease subunit
VGLYLKLAIRNIFRNKRRTFIAGFAIGIGLASLIFTDALIKGMEQNLIQSATASFLGEGEIHAKGFRESYDVEKTIVDAPKVVDELSHDPIVAHFTQRAMSFAMLNSPANLSAVTMVGVDPSTEKYLSQIDDALIKGDYFTGDEQRDLIIGKKLAELLEVEIGDRVVMTVAQAGSGDLSQEMFRVSGIFLFNSDEMDRGMAFIRLKKAQQMLAIDGRIHEIAINFTDSKYGQDENLPFWKKYSQDGNEAVGWTVLLPQLKNVLAMSQFSTFIVGIILFAVVALGIINTLFMSLHERMFEFGVLRAVGTRPLTMARLIVFEAGALAVLSIVIGTVLGYILTYIFTKVGIDYTGIEFVGVTFRNLLYPIMETRQYVFFPLTVFLFTVVIAIYPALHAARLVPAEAMRRSF